MGSELGAHIVIRQIYTQTRVLQYVGPLEFVLDAMEKRSVKGSAPANWNGGELRIYEAVLGDAPQKLDIRYIREMVEAHKAGAQNFYPDDDSQREGYLMALDWILGELPL